MKADRGTRHAPSMRVNVVTEGSLGSMSSTRVEAQHLLLKPAIPLLFPGSPARVQDHCHLRGEQSDCSTRGDQAVAEVHLENFN